MTAAECVAEAAKNGLGNILEELEQNRQVMLGKNRTIMLWVGGITLVAMVWLLAIKMPWLYLVPTALVGLIIGMIITGRRKGRAGFDYKDRAIPALLQHALPEFSYYGGSCIPVDEFNASGLFIAPDRYTGKDLFEGQADKTGVHFSQVHAEERYETSR